MDFIDLPTPDAAVLADWAQALRAMLAAALQALNVNLEAP
jgi:hypothetical protein